MPRKGVGEALRKFFKPEDEAKAAERQEELELFRAQQIVDRRAYIKSLDQERDQTLNRMRDELKALVEDVEPESRAAESVGVPQVVASEPDELLA